MLTEAKPQLQGVADILAERIGPPLQQERTIALNAVAIVIAEVRKSNYLMGVWELVAPAHLEIMTLYEVSLKLPVSQQILEYCTTLPDDYRALFIVLEALGETSVYPYRFYVGD